MVPIYARPTTVEHRPRAGMHADVFFGKEASGIFFVFGDGVNGLIGSLGISLNLVLLTIQNCLSFFLLLQHRHAQDASLFPLPARLALRLRLPPSTLRKTPLTFNFYFIISIFYPLDVTSYVPRPLEDFAPVYLAHVAWLVLVPGLFVPATCISSGPLNTTTTTTPSGASRRRPPLPPLPVCRAAACFSSSITIQSISSVPPSHSIHAPTPPDGNRTSNLL